MDTSRMPEELKMAIEAWSVLYKDKEKERPFGGHKYQIIRWLEENAMHLSENAMMRIATLINPYRAGGALPNEKRIRPYKKRKDHCKTATTV